MIVGTNSCVAGQLCFEIEGGSDVQVETDV